MAKLRATDVFTPGTFPSHTYVERDSAVLERRLTDARATQGSIVSIIGPSKSGKTVLVERVVGKDNLIPITGAGLRDAEQIWDRALTWMRSPDSLVTTDSASTNNTVTTNAKAGFSVLGIGSAEAGGSAVLGRSTGTGSSRSFERAGLPQVVREIANSDFVLLLDDFHYMARDLQAEVAKQIKEGARLGLKICVAAVKHRADDVVRANPDLRGRVIAIDLEYWQPPSLEQIPRLGFSKLNSSIDDASIKTFARESAGSPQLMQSICLNACFHLGLREEADITTKTVIPREAQCRILENTAASTDYRTTVSILDGGPKTRGTERKVYKFKTAGEGDVYRCILRALASDPPQLSFRYDEILKRVADVCASDIPVGSSVIGSCQHMAKLADEKHPDQRVLDWNEDKQVLDMPDPYLLFFLRWSGHIGS